MNKHISDLVNLQNIDSELDRVKLRKKELPERKAVLEEQLQSAAEAFENEKRRLDEAGKTHKQKEENLKRGIENLKRTKERLLEVKTNKEYQAMLKEIEVLEKKNSECEDEIIYALEEMDRAKTGVAEKEKEILVFKQSCGKDMTQIELELNTIDQEFERLSKEREQLESRLAKDLLKRYETIKSRRNGRAVVPVWKGVCDGCHMNIPPQMYIELQKAEELMQCPFCSRIIYWDREHHE